MIDSDGPPLGPAELASELKCSRHTVDNAIKSGVIPAARIGKRLFIPRRVAIEILTNGRIPEPVALSPKHIDPLLVAAE